MNASSPLRRGSLLLLILAVLSLAGCGGKRAKIKGKVVLPTGVKLEESDTLQVSLTSTGTPPLTAGGKVSLSDLSFTVDSGDHKGVPPGKYRVDVTLTPYAGEQKSMERKKKLDVTFAPFSGEKSSLSVDVTADSEQTITVDLDKKTVTK